MVALYSIDLSPVHWLITKWSDGHLSNDAIIMKNGEIKVSKAEYTKGVQFRSVAWNLRSILIARRVQ